MRIGDATRIMRPIVDFTAVQIDPKDRKQELERMAEMEETLEAVKRYHPGVVTDSRRKLKAEVGEVVEMLRDGKHEEVIDRFPRAVDNHTDRIVFGKALRSVGKQTSDAVIEIMAERAWNEVKDSSPKLTIVPPTEPHNPQP